MTQTSLGTHCVGFNIFLVTQCTVKVLILLLIAHFTTDFKSKKEKNIIYWKNMLIIHSQMKDITETQITYFSRILILVNAIY